MCSACRKPPSALDPLTNPSVLRRRPEAPPARVAWRFVEIGELPWRLGMGLPVPLWITAQTQRGPQEGLYFLTPHRDHEGRTVGWRLERDEGETYDLPADLSACDCRDHLFRRRECKHVFAVRGALAALRKEAA